MYVTEPESLPYLPLAGSCANCTLAASCLPARLADEQLLRLGNLVTRSIRLGKGEILFRAGQRFGAIYIPRSGFLKTSALLEDGREQVLSFALPGDLVGADGIGSDVYRSDTVALEDSTVCVVPFAELEALSREVPQLQRNLHRLMSREIARERAAIALLAGLSAHARLAAFLIALSQRFAARGYSATEFRLPMRREEIGSYLGLKHETVSRGLTGLGRSGLLEVRARHVRIVDLAALRALAGTGDIAEPAVRSRPSVPARPPVERRAS